MKKRIISLLLTFVLCVLPMGMVFAAPVTINPGMPSGDASEDITGVANSLIGAMQMIGYVVAVVMLVYIGIKYVTAGAGQKAEVKSTLVPMLAGAILIVSAVTIASWVWSAVGGS